MKVCGIIAEFNPFTNGHSYIISQAKQITGLDILCLMSGNFVQRGELAIIDKYKRSTTAIKEGASYVFELPTQYAISPAQNFAEGAIKTLDKLGIVSHLAFGVKLKDIEGLKKIAYIKANEPKIVKEKMKQLVKLGLNYNSSIFNVYHELFPEFKSCLNEIQNEPNNILALEYLTSIYKLKSNIQPVFINRIDNGYNSLRPIQLNINNKKQAFVSASKIRELINNNKRFARYVPKNSLIYFKNLTGQDKQKLDDKFEALVVNNIRNKSYEQLESLFDYNKNLAHIIKNAFEVNGSLPQIIEALKSKSLREKRIKRLLLYSLLNITKENYNLYCSSQFITLLAIDKTKKANLSKISKQSSLNMIVSQKDLKTLEEKNIKTLEQENTNIYNILHSKPYSQDLTMFI